MVLTISCVFGLSHSGKSTFIACILKYLENQFQNINILNQCSIIDFDTLQHTFINHSENNVEFSPTLWKEGRKQGLLLYQKLISEYVHSSCNHFIFLDDTFYLNSMRKKIIQMTYKYSKINFHFIFINTPYTICYQRFKEHFTTKTNQSSLLKEKFFFDKLYAKWNPHNVNQLIYFVNVSNRFSWEKRSYCDCWIIDSSMPFHVSNFHQIFHQIDTLQCSSLHVEPMDSTLFKNQNMAQFLHNSFDKELRLHISEAVKTIRHTNPSLDSISATVKQWNSIRKSYSKEFKEYIRKKKNNDTLINIYYKLKHKFMYQLSSSD